MIHVGPRAGQSTAGEKRYQTADRLRLRPRGERHMLDMNVLSIIASRGSIYPVRCGMSGEAAGGGIKTFDSGSTPGKPVGWPRIPGEDERNLFWPARLREFGERARARAGTVSDP